MLSIENLKLTSLYLRANCPSVIRHNFFFPSGIRRCCAWKLPLRHWPPSPESRGSKDLLCAEGFQVRVRDGVNTLPVACHVTISDEYIDLTTRRLGSVRIILEKQMEEITFDDAVKTNNEAISMLVLKLRFGSAAKFPPSLTNDHGEIQASNSCGRIWRNGRTPRIRLPKSLLYFIITQNKRMLSSVELY